MIFEVKTDLPTASFFAAANSGDGFVSWFDELFADRASKRIIIKGGPGTGKSHMLFKLASAATECGGRVEYYFCSSDSDSLDGIVAFMPDGQIISAVDGTSPHSAEAALPGVRDRIFDLGRFWSEKKLSESQDEIKALNSKKTLAWKRAFLCLGAAKRQRQAALLIAERSFDAEKLEKTAKRIAGEIKRSGDAGELTEQLLSPGALRGRIHSPHLGIGMKGTAALSGMTDNADEIWYIADSPFPGAAMLLLTETAKFLSKCRVSPDPLDPTLVRAVRYGNALCIADAPGIGKKVHRVGMKRFYRAGSLSATSAEYSFLTGACDSCLLSALSAMSEASRYHFRLEEIYSKAMDFSKKEDEVAKLCGEIF